MEDNSEQIGILVESDIFTRGLREVFRDTSLCSMQPHVLKPAVAIKYIKSGILDALILDTDSAPKLAHVLKEHENRPKVILVSCRRHAGIRCVLPKDRICCFYSARSTEWEMKHLLNIVLPCRAGPDGYTGCNECMIRRSLQPRSLPLSARESEVFKLIGLLHKSSEIAEQLDISVKTVEAHCTNIKRKLDLRNGRELLREAASWVEGY